MNTCKTCKHFDNDTGSHTGECKRMIVVNEDKSIVGSMVNPIMKHAREVFSTEGYQALSKEDHELWHSGIPHWITDPEPSEPVNGLYFWNGGQYDAVTVGKDFGCIHHEANDR